jgi:hypothetical protein
VTIGDPPVGISFLLESSKCAGIGSRSWNNEMANSGNLDLRADTAFRLRSQRHGG